MKILHVLDSVNRGGAETLILDVCRNAAAFGLEVMIAAGDGPLLDEFANCGRPFFHLDRRLPFDPMHAGQLRRIIRSKGIDLVHTHQAVDAIHSLAAAAGLKVPVVLSHHGIVPDAKNRRATKFLLSRVAHNIVVAETVIRTYNELYGIRFGANTSVIYNGVDTSRLSPEGGDLRAEMGIGPDVPLIGMIGNFYPEKRKDQLTVCRSLPKVIEHFPDTRCVFIGGVEPGAGAKFDECRQFCDDNQIGERVHFLGRRSDVPDILSALDIFVFSSFQEGLPIALNEAMLAGVPTIVSDIPSLIEASGTGQYSMVFPVGDEAVLAEKVLSLLKEPALRGELARNAHGFAASNFTIEAHLARLAELYRSLRGS
ncbi:MAG: glycosyltransferase family 4 protein [Pyrinomonadaceae bacterium]|nr:glycosyltransferase family 4 protein [Pyrinomonadaceae bacterium]